LATPISYGRRVRSLLAALLVAAGLSAVASSSASAYSSYNCGMIPPGSYCNPTIPYWGPVALAFWNSSTKSTGTLPVRINRGSIGPTAWQSITESDIAFFPYAPQGLAQVKNNTGQTHQITVLWRAW